MSTSIPNNLDKMLNSVFSGVKNPQNCLVLPADSELVKLVEVTNFFFNN